MIILHNYDSVYCDLETLKQILRKEYAGRVIPGQPQTKSRKTVERILLHIAEGEGR